MERVEGCSAHGVRGVSVNHTPLRYVTLYGPGAASRLSLLFSVIEVTLSMFAGG